MLSKIIIGLTIHLLLPLSGLIAFLRIKKQMTVDGIIDAPILGLFIIFITYGGLLLVTLTSLFWVWSGLASFGTFYLIIGAPIAMGIIAYSQFKKRKISKYNKRVYQISLMYFIIAPLVYLSLFLLEELKQ